MSRSDKVRTGPCSRADAVGRLKQAQAAVMVSELCLADDTSVATVAPDGAKMAKLLREVLAAKDDSHSGVALVSVKQAQALVRKAGTLTAWAERIVNA